MKIFILCILLLSLSVQAEDQIVNGYIYSRPSFGDIFTNIPHNLVGSVKEGFQKDKIGAWAVIAASTTLLYVYDRKIKDHTQAFGRSIGLGNGDGTKSLVRVGSVSIFRGPTDVGSAMYFLGDGWTTMLTSAGFLIGGKIHDDNRALQTSAQLMNGLLITGIITQVLKRSTGRESPSAATSERGRWRPFPSWSQFQNHTSHYDAFPSGHLATAMTTVTILANNYEDYPFIKPLGYSLMGLLSFQMVNNNVHWVSDYPLAIGIGYVIGKTVSHNGRKKVAGETEEKTSYEYEFAPTLSAQGQPGIALNISY